jgi:hypothetical protein
MKIIFLDVDGPLIPGRMYYESGSTFICDPLNDQKVSHRYDPIAVGMIKALCDATGAKVVFNSAHNGGGPASMKWQAKCNDLHEYLHETEWTTQFPNGYGERINGIRGWLENHPEVTTWIDIDDELVPTNRLVHVHFDIGMTIDNYRKALWLLTNQEEKISVPHTIVEIRAPELSD